MAAKDSVAKILLVHEDQLPLAFEHLDDLILRARRLGIPVSKLPMDEQGEVVLTRATSPHALTPEAEIPGWPAGISHEDALEFAFGLIYMLGFELRVFLRGGRSYKMYTVPGVELPPEQREWFGGVIDKRVMEESWDEILRVIASTHQATLTASVAFLRIPGEMPRVYEGLREIGRGIKTEFFLRVAQDKELRELLVVGDASVVDRVAADCVRTAPRRPGTVNWNDPRWVEFMALFKAFDAKWGRHYEKWRKAADGGRGSRKEVDAAISGFSDRMRVEMFRDLDEIQLKMAPLLADAILRGELTIEEIEGSPFALFVSNALGWIRRVVMGERDPDHRGIIDGLADPGASRFIPVEKAGEFADELGSRVEDARLLREIVRRAVGEPGTLAPAAIGRISRTWAENAKQLASWKDILEDLEIDEAAAAYDDDLDRVEARLGEYERLAGEIASLLEQGLSRGVAARGLGRS